MNTDERLAALEVQLAAFARDKDILRDQLSMQQRDIDQLIDMVVELASRQVAMMSPAQRALANEAINRDPALPSLIDLRSTKQ